MEDFIVGTLVKSEIEADGRDLVAEAVLPTPTKEELKSLPEEYSNLGFVGATYYQNGRGSCTALGTSHSLLVQNVEELITKNPTLNAEITKKIKGGTNPIFLDWKDLWTKMGHKLDDKKDSGDYVENALNKANKEGIAGTGYLGNSVTFFGLSYSFSKDYSKEMLKYNIWKYKALVMVISGTSQTRNEMREGEVKAVIEKINSTGAHCIACVGYDSYGLIFVNSRKPNDEANKLCTFKVSRANVGKMLNVGMFNRRYRIEFDKSDSILDIDVYIEENNAIEILKLLNKFYNKTRFKDVQTKTAELGATIRKNYPRANIEVPLK